MDKGRVDKTTAQIKSTQTDASEDFIRKRRRRRCCRGVSRAGQGSDYQGEEQIELMLKSKCCGEYLRDLTSSNIESKGIILVTLLIHTGFKLDLLSTFIL